MSNNNNNVDGYNEFQKLKFI